MTQKKYSRLQGGDVATGGIYNSSSLALGPVPLHALGPHICHDANYESWWPRDFWFRYISMIPPSTSTYHMSIESPGLRVYFIPRIHNFPVQWRVHKVSNAPERKPKTTVTEVSIRTNPMTRVLVDAITRKLIPLKRGYDGTAEQMIMVRTIRSTRIMNQLVFNKFVV